MIAQLKSLNVDRIDLDEAVSLLAFANSVGAEYEAQGLPIPEWLQDAARTLRNEIALRARDAREKRVKELRRSLDGLRTTEEKRKSYQKELRELEVSLNGGSKA